MPSPVTVAVVRARALRALERDGRDWAAAGGEAAVLDVPLHPPTERAVLTDLDGARAWVDAWRAEDASPHVAVQWATRSWARVGAQQVPERVRVEGADAIAAVAGSTSAWARLVARTTAVRVLVDETSPHADRGDALLRPQLRAIAALDDDDAQRLLDAVRWLREHPDSGRFVRELPIRGIDSKWIEAHRSIVAAVLSAATGRADLGLLEVPALLRLRVLDPKLALGGLADVTASVAELAALALEPDAVLVVENLQTMLAMPAARGTVVLHGGGYRVPHIAAVPWAQRVTYWGDLDSHGFAILHRLRRHGVDARSVLMDTETLLAHRDLWGVDPKPTLAHLDALTDDEQATLQRLSAEGNVRLEQERVPWDYALGRLCLRD